MPWIWLLGKKGEKQVIGIAIADVSLQEEIWGLERPLRFMELLTYTLCYNAAEN